MDRRPPALLLPAGAGVAGSVAALASLAGNADAETTVATPPPDPQHKVLLTNLAIAGFIGAWGAANWDYGDNGWQVADEGWFGQQTDEGGADKAGHLYTGYVLARSLSGLYRHYGLAGQDARDAGALSALGAMTFMEFGDGFSPYGWSNEDAAMNVAGTALGWWLAGHPALDRRFALRGEYRFHAEHAQDVLTDYERWRYYATLKLDGFDAMPEPLRWVELHAGWYARGYADADPANDRRLAFVGIGLSLPKLARAVRLPRTAVFLDYFQPPGTVLIDEHRQR